MAHKSRTREAFRPTLETLEDRRLLTLGVWVYGGTTYIEGTDSADRVVIDVASAPYGGGYTITENGTVTHVLQTTEMQKINFYGFGGDDYFENNIPWLSVVANGADGRDTLIGSDMNDDFWGGPGNDELDGGNGHDTLRGEGGMDVLLGRDGNDMLQGGESDDVLHGGWGHDWLYGDSGWDQLYGSLGNDYLNGGQDGIRDYLVGGWGADYFVSDWSGPFWCLVNLDANADFDLFEALRNNDPVAFP